MKAPSPKKKQKVMVWSGRCRLASIIFDIRSKRVVSLTRRDFYPPAHRRRKRRQRLPRQAWCSKSQSFMRVCWAFFIEKEVMSCRPYRPAGRSIWRCLLRPIARQYPVLFLFLCRDLKDLGWPQLHLLSSGGIKVIGSSTRRFLVCELDLRRRLALGTAGGRGMQLHWHYWSNMYQHFSASLSF